jgi:hypothetical protein
MTDISGKIAKVLFTLGILWAVVLAPFWIVSLLAPRYWGVTLYILCGGYGVWWGWFRRGWREMSRRQALALWMSSIGVNSFWPVFLWREYAQRSLDVFELSRAALLFWFWITAIIASLIALCFEPRSRKE